MKKSLPYFLTLLLLGLGFQSFAQSHQYALSLVTGGNRSLSSGSAIINSDPKAIFGPTGGLGLQFNFSSVFAVKTSLEFEQKGFKSPFGYYSYENNSTLKFQHAYLTVPILLRATFGRNFRYFVNAGPYLGFALKHHYSIKQPDQPTIENDEKKSFTNRDIGVSFGIGVIYPLSSTLELSLEARNNLGLTNIYVGEYLFRPGYVYKTNSHSLLLGLSYKLVSKN